MIDRNTGKAVAQVLDCWTGVEQLSNRTASVYLRALLLTDARRDEMAALKWLMWIFSGTSCSPTSKLRWGVKTSDSVLVTA